MECAGNEFRPHGRHHTARLTIYLLRDGKCSVDGLAGLVQGFAKLGSPLGGKVSTDIAQTCVSKIRRDQQEVLGGRESTLSARNICILLQNLGEEVDESAVSVLQRVALASILAQSSRLAPRDVCVFLATFLATEHVGRILEFGNHLVPKLTSPRDVSTAACALTRESLMKQIRGSLRPAGTSSQGSDNINERSLQDRWRCFVGQLLGNIGGSGCGPVEEFRSAANGRPSFLEAATATDLAQLLTAMSRFSCHKTGVESASMWTPEDEMKMRAAAGALVAEVLARCPAIVGDWNPIGVAVSFFSLSNLARAVRTVFSTSADAEGGDSSSLGGTKRQPSSGRSLVEAGFYRVALSPEQFSSDQLGLMLFALWNCPKLLGRSRMLMPSADEEDHHHDQHGRGPPRGDPRSTRRSPQMSENVDDDIFAHLDPRLLRPLTEAFEAKLRNDSWSPRQLLNVLVCTPRFDSLVLQRFRTILESSTSTASRSVTTSSTICGPPRGTCSTTRRLHDAGSPVRPPRPPQVEDVVFALQNVLVGSSGRRLSFLHFVDGSKKYAAVDVLTQWLARIELEAWSRLRVLQFIELSSGVASSQISSFCLGLGFRWLHEHRVVKTSSIVAPHENKDLARACAGALRVLAFTMPASSIIGLSDAMRTELAAALVHDFVVAFERTLHTSGGGKISEPLHSCAGVVESARKTDLHLHNKAVWATLENSIHAARSILVLKFESVKWWCYAVSVFATQAQHIRGCFIPPVDVGELVARELCELYVAAPHIRTLAKRVEGLDDDPIRRVDSWISQLGQQLQIVLDAKDQVGRTNDLSDHVDYELASRFLEAYALMSSTMSSLEDSSTMAPVSFKRCAALLSQRFFSEHAGAVAPHVFVASAAALEHIVGDFPAANDIAIRQFCASLHAFTPRQLTQALFAVTLANATSPRGTCSRGLCPAATVWGVALRKSLLRWKHYQVTDPQLLSKLQIVMYTYFWTISSTQTRPVFTEEISVPKSLLHYLCGPSLLILQRIILHRKIQCEDHTGSSDGERTSSSTEQPQQQSAEEISFGSGQRRATSSFLTQSVSEGDRRYRSSLHEQVIKTFEQLQDEAGGESTLDVTFEVGQEGFPYIMDMVIQQR